MTSKDYKATILDKIKAVLKPLKFVKHGQTFKYSNGDLTYYIDLQSSKYSTATEIKVTVNIGIGSELLYRLEGKTITSHLRGHFTKRIGQFTKFSIDKWWTITSAQTADLAGREIASIIGDKVLVEFDRIKSTYDLVDYWLQGYRAGLTDMQVNQYLLLLDKAKTSGQISSGM